MTKRSHNFIDMSGRRCGLWQVLAFDSIVVRGTSHNAFWRCLCTRCGREDSIKGSDLRQGRSTACRSCGVKKGCGDIPGSFWCSILKGARKRKFDVVITVEDAWQLFLEQDRCCALTGIQLYFPRSLRGLGTVSLDRIRSEDGYIEGNVQWVHKVVNLMKLDMQPEEFINWCQRVAQFNERISCVS